MRAQRNRFRLGGGFGRQCYISLMLPPLTKTYGFLRSRLLSGSRCGTSIGSESHVLRWRCSQVQAWLLASPLLFLPHLLCSQGTLAREPLSSAQAPSPRAAGRGVTEGAWGSGSGTSLPLWWCGAQKETEMLAGISMLA